MKNKKATPLGKFEFSTAEDQVSQCNVRYTTETTVIHFDQERFEQLLSGGSINPLHVRKHRELLWLKFGGKSLLRQTRFFVSLPQWHARIRKNSIEVFYSVNRDYSGLHQHAYVA